MNYIGDDPRAKWKGFLENREIPYKLTMDEVLESLASPEVLTIPEFLVGYFQFLSNKAFIDNNRQLLSAAIEAFIDV